MFIYWLKRLFWLLILLLESHRPVFAQVLKGISLDSCHVLAAKHYPLTRQYDLIAQSEAYTLENISKGILPQFHIGGQATYQSDVTSIPDQPFPPLNKDQYRIYGELNQPLTAFFTVDKDKAFAKVNATVSSKKTEVELYQLRERINQLYFGLLLIDEQLKQAALIKDDLNAGIQHTTAAVQYGMALKSELKVLQAEVLKTDQKIITLKSDRKKLSDVLAAFTGLLPEAFTQLETPPTPELSIRVSRPELALYQHQKEAYGIRQQLINNRTLPQFSLYFQGGYGRPGMNMLNNTFRFYYIGGIRLHWNIAEFYTNKREKQLLNLEQNSLDVQQETFVFDTQLAIRRESHEIKKLKALIKTDHKIIQLREEVTKTSKAKLENGTITSTDYVTFVNAEDLARQDQILHSIQLLETYYKNKNTTGN